MKKIIYLLFVALMVVSTTISQDLQVQIIMSPKPSPYLTDWQDKSETIQLVVTNLTENEINFRIGAKVYAGSQFDNNLQAATKLISMPVHSIIGFETIIFDGVDIVPYEAIEFYNSVEQSVIRTGKLPSRDYTICLTLYEEISGSELTTPVCKPFFLDSYQQPNLIYPINNSDIPITSLQGQVFRWTPVVPTPSGIVNYTLFGMRVESWQQPMQAFKVNNPFFEIELPLQTQSVWPPDFDLPNIGETIVWSVRATDEEGRPIGEQDGIATPYVFNVIDVGIDKADLCNCKPVTDGASIRAASDLGADAFTSGNTIFLKKGEPEKALVAHEAAHVVQQRSSNIDGNRKTEPIVTFDNFLKNSTKLNPDIEITYNWNFFGVNNDGTTFTSESNKSEFIFDFPDLKEGRLSVTGMVICAANTCQFKSDVKVIVDQSNTEIEKEKIELSDVPDGVVEVVPVDSDGDGFLDYIDFKTMQRQTPKTDFGSFLNNMQPELVVDLKKDNGISYIECYPKKYIAGELNQENKQWQGIFNFIFTSENGEIYNGYRESDIFIFTPHSTGNLEIQFIGTYFPDGVHPLFADTLGININFFNGGSSTAEGIEDFSTNIIYNPFNTLNNTEYVNFDYPDFGGNSLEFVSNVKNSTFQTIEIDLEGLELLNFFEAFRKPPPLFELPGDQKGELDLGDWAVKFEPADGSSPIFINSSQSNDFYFIPPCSGILDVNFKGKKKGKNDNKKEETLDLNYKKIVLSNPSVNKNKGKNKTKDKKVIDLTQLQELDKKSQKLFIGPLEKIEKNKLKLTDMTDELDFTEIILPVPRTNKLSKKGSPLYSSNGVGGEITLFEGIYSNCSTYLSQTNYYIIPSGISYVNENGIEEEIPINQNEKSVKYARKSTENDHIGNYNFSISILKEELKFSGSSEEIDEEITPTLLRIDYSIPKSEIGRSELISLVEDIAFTKYGNIEKNISNKGESCESSFFVDIYSSIYQHRSAPLTRIYVDGIRTTDVKESQLNFTTVGTNLLSDNPNELADLIKQWFTDNKIGFNNISNAKVTEQTINQYTTKSISCEPISLSFNQRISKYTEVSGKSYWNNQLSTHNIELKTENYRDILANNLLKSSMQVEIDSKINTSRKLQWQNPESINLKIFSSDNVDLKNLLNMRSISTNNLEFTPPLLYNLFDKDPLIINNIIQELESTNPILTKKSINGGQYDLSDSDLVKGSLYFALLEESSDPSNMTLLPFWIPESYNDSKSSKGNISSDFTYEPGFKIISPKPGDEYELLNNNYTFTRLDNDEGIYYTLYYENSSTNNPEIKKDCDSIATNTENPFGPNSSEEWIALRDSLRQAESDLDYWRNRCPQEDERNEVRENNIRILNQNIERLKQWARELGISLPENKDCNFRECCPPNGDCCEGIDPSTEEGRSAYLEKMRCITRRLNELNGTMNADMGNFIDQMNFWNRREDSRNTWIMYHWYFSNVEWILSGGPITDAIDYMKEHTGFNDLVEWLGREAWNRFCSGFNLTDEQCDQAKQLLRDIQDAKEKYDDAKEAADAVKEIIMAARNSRGFPPALIIKMTAMMAGAVAEETGNMVEFYNSKFLEMTGTAQNVMNTMLCLKQYYALVSEMDKKCGNFCEETITHLEQEVERLKKEKDRVRDAFIESERNSAREAGESIDEAIRRILSFFNDPIGHNRLMCCSEGNETQIFNYPEDENKNDCAKMIANQLKLSLGEKYCWLKITVTVICTQRNTEINYEFEVMRERNEDCCPDDIEEIPIGGRRGDDLGEDEEGEIVPPNGSSNTNGGRIRIGAGNDGGPNDSPAGSGQRTTPWQPVPEDKPPHRGDKGKCVCDIKLTYNGKGLKPNGKIVVDYGSPASISAAGKCEGDCFKDGNWLVVDPPPMNNFPFINIPPTKFVGTNFSTSKNFGFYIPGQWNFRFYQRCSDGSLCSVGLKIIVKKPDRPDKGKPDFDIDTTDQDTDRCGADTCLQIEYNHYIGKNPSVKKRMFGVTITRKSTGFTKLDLDTECIEVCLNDQNKVTWLIRRPDGRLDTKVGVNLYSILYEFDIKGKYEICIIEQKGCKKGINRSYSRTFYVKVE